MTFCDQVGRCAKDFPRRVLWPMQRLIAIVLMLISTVAQATSAPLLLSDGIGRYSTAGHLEYLEDASGSLTLADMRDAASAGRFQPVKQLTPSFGFTSSSFWFHIKLENHSVTTKDWLLEILYPPLDNVDVYLVSSDGAYQRMSGGDRLPFDARALKSRNINFHLEIPPGDTRNAYIHVRTASSMQLPLVLWDTSTYIDAHEAEQHLIGLFYGILTGLLVFNLILFLSTQDKPYLYYVYYLLAYFLFQATLHGLTYEYFWPNAPVWANAALPIFLCCASQGGTEFTRSFLDVNKNFPHLSGLFTGFTILVLATAAASFLTPYSLVIRLATLAGIIASVIAFSTGVYALAKGVKQARYFMIAWSVFLIGSILYALKTFGLLPSVFITDYGQQIGSALEVILLSMALADRLRILKVENERMQRQATADLEKRVQERTRELDATLQKLAYANHALQELNLVDTLTGIKNRKFFNECYAKEWRSAVRQGYPIALIMVDIDHFKSVNDRYGHLFGDACIKKVAEILQDSMVRPSEYAARYGGEEFCLILSRSDSHSVLKVAEDVRQRVEDCEVLFGNEKLILTVSLGCAVMVPKPEDNPVSLIADADAALYEAKRLGRNQVQIHAQYPLDDDNASRSVVAATHLRKSAGKQTALRSPAFNANDKIPPLY